MKKLILVFIIMLLFNNYPVSAIPDPIYGYCEERGYTIEEGDCVFTDGNRCELYSFYDGECGQEYVSEVPCAEAGEQAGVSIDCCEGLNALETTRVNEEGVCEYSIGGYGTCSDCGNSICENLENICNCPVDCESEIEEEENCYSESQIPVTPNVQCCEGQTRMGPKEEGILGSGICTANCGNNICDRDLESENNCPKDCKNNEEGISQSGAISIIQESRDIDKINSVKLTTRNQEEVYILEATQKGRLLFIIPINIKITATINASNGNIEEFKKPWWAIFVW